VLDLDGIGLGREMGEMRGYHMWMWIGRRRSVWEVLIDEVDVEEEGRELT
jgi:hypothetical protein